MPQAERRVQGPVILGSTLRASTSRVTSVPVPRPSCGSTLVSGHGDSSMGSFSPPTYGHTAVGGQQRQVARVDSHGASAPCLGAAWVLYMNRESKIDDRVHNAVMPGTARRPRFRLQLRIVRVTGLTSAAARKG